MPCRTRMGMSTLADRDVQIGLYCFRTSRKRSRQNRSNSPRDVYTQQDDSDQIPTQPQRKMMMMTVIVISYSCYCLFCFQRRNTHAINNNATCHVIWPPNDCVAQYPQIGNAMYAGHVAIVNTTYTLLELSCIIATYNDRKHNLHQSRHAMHDGHLHRS